VLGLGLLASLGWIAAASETPARTAPAGSELNTASQKTFENTGTLVDVTDAPVSLPSERVIYPPSTGGAGLVEATEASTVAGFALIGATLSLIAVARLATAPRRSS
jgi:hypothetical protein